MTTTIPQTDPNKERIKLIRLWAIRIVIYIILTFFALLMLFPFIYMMSTSFKTSDDVFEYPPRVLPYSPITEVINGEALEIFEIAVDGETREMVPTGAKVSFGNFTSIEGLNVDAPRESEIVAEGLLPNDDIVDTGDVHTYTDSNGTENELPLYDIDGEQLVLIHTLTGQNTTYGNFTTIEALNMDDPRASEIVAEGIITNTAVVNTGEIYTYTDSDGDENEVPIYTVDGEELLLIITPRIDVMVDIDGANVVGYTTLRNATAVEEVKFNIDNYDTVFFSENIDLRRALINTTIVTIGVTLGQLITSIFGGYAFARLKFRGRDTLFLAYLGSIMVPFVVLIVPMYRLMVVMGWEGRIVSLIVPWIFTAYGTFLMRQFFITIPKELEEAALLDGCSRVRILWTIFVPLSTPAVATLGIFSFLYAWNSFLWPLLIIGEGNLDNRVLTLSLISLSNIASDEPNIVLTGAAVAILPPILIFILAQKYFIEGVASSGLKG